MVPTAQDLSKDKIHNELLCFCVNKAKTVPFETILKIGTDFYSGDMIQEAKETLWESVISVVLPGRKDLRLIKRKATTAGCKERADLEDIMKALQVCDREGIVLPQFYALDLGKIPPASPEQVDVSVLLAQLSIMQDEMQGLKRAVQSQAQFSIMQDEMQGLKRAVQSLQSKPKEPEATATWARVASAPPSQQTMPVTQLPSQPVSGEQTNGQPKPPQPAKPVPPQPSAAGQPSNCPRQQVDEDGFIQVARQKKTSRRRLEVKGSSSSTLLRGVAAPPKKVDLFVGRLDMTTTTAAVEMHTNWLMKDGGKVSVEEIPHCAEAYGYKGFKISVPIDTVDRVLQPDGWPTHVSIKRFYQPRGSKGSKGAAPKVSDVKALTRCASVGSVAVTM